MKKAFSINSNLLFNLTSSTFPTFDHFYDSNSQHWEMVPEISSKAPVSKLSCKLKIPSLLATTAHTSSLPVQAWHP